MNRTLLFAGALVLLSLAISWPASAGSPSADAEFQQVATAILEDLYRRNPTWGTDLGLHQWDPSLEDYSMAAVRDEVAAIGRFRGALERIDPAGLTLTNRLDRELLLHSLESRRLTDEAIRPLQRNPDVYSSGITNSAYSLIKREFAPAPERLRSLIARERKMPSVLAAARRNLADPPRIYTEIAIEQLDGSEAFFRTAVVEAFAGVEDPALQREFKRTNDAVIAALRDYKAWLVGTVLPRSHGRFAYGADLYRRKLSADEMIDTPLDELLKLAEADLHRNQMAFAETARRIDPTRPPLEVLATVQRDHPPPERLLETTQAELDALARFMTEHHIVTIPKDAPPARVKETPPFMRATTSASMDTPGPFETAKLRGFYNMTLPDPAWSDAQKEDFMRQWFYALITNVSVHEVWPGHYLQFLYAKDYPTNVRKVLGANSNSEGWAHYCEQMLVDEGFHADDPRYRLAQIEDALLRDARFIVGIRMHTQGMTIAQAEDFFVKEGYQPRALAVSETKRGTSDALYGYYTMGKLAILKLREDDRRRQGPSWSRQDFHDRFIALGPLPLPLVREALLGERGSLF
ncbi:MAG TPA: DUF885 domain-containing protein [Steroidobacteraceae bacterium]|nr:DUF885 domain-containing protein [Steroidobacteraceae bacterium]